MSLIMFLGAPTMLLPPQHNGRFAPHHPRAMVSMSAPEEPEVFCASGSLCRGVSDFHNCPRHPPVPPSPTRPQRGCIVLATSACDRNTKGLAAH